MNDSNNPQAAANPQQPQQQQQQQQKEEDYSKYKSDKVEELRELFPVVNAISWVMLMDFITYVKSDEGVDCLAKDDDTTRKDKPRVIIQWIVFVAFAFASCAYYLDRVQQINAGQIREHEGFVIKHAWNKIKYVALHVFATVCYVLCIAEQPIKCHLKNDAAIENLRICQFCGLAFLSGFFAFVPFQIFSKIVKNQDGTETETKFVGIRNPTRFEPLGFSCENLNCSSVANMCGGCCGGDKRPIMQKLKVADEIKTELDDVNKRIDEIQVKLVSLVQKPKVEDVDVVSGQTGQNGNGGQGGQGGPATGNNNQNKTAVDDQKDAQTSTQLPDALSQQINQNKQDGLNVDVPAPEDKDKDEVNSQSGSQGTGIVGAPHGPSAKK